MSATPRRSPSPAHVLTAWLARVVFALAFALGTMAGTTWAERDLMEEREREGEGEGEGEDGKIAEALALEVAEAHRTRSEIGSETRSEPEWLRAQLPVPASLTPRHATPAPVTWQRPRRSPPEDDDPAGR